MSTLLAAATLNNTLCVSVFMGLVYARNLKWTFFAETVTIVLVVLLASAIGYRQTVRMWHAVLLVLLFPAALVLIYTLNKYMPGW